MPDPFPVPIGLRLNQAARAVGRAFDEALAAAGGSLPVWLVLLNLKIRRPGTQRELAEAVGISEATLTHHLNAMDTAGLITRTRDAANRRIQIVALTEEGETAFLRLRGAAVAFDERLRAGLAESEIATLTALLTRLTGNVAEPAGPGSPWASLADSH
jgi:MarR family transcriptional regulator for hemolysin